MRWLWVLPAGVGGGAVGLVGLVVHRHAVWLAGWPLPWGAALAVLAPAVVALLLRGRGPLLLGFVLGWLGALVLALGDGPGGDFVLMSDVLGWGFLVTSVLTIAVVVGLGAATRRTPSSRRERERPAERVAR